MSYTTTIEIANGTPIDCWIDDGKVVVVILEHLLADTEEE